MTSELWGSRRVFWLEFLAAFVYNRWAAGLRRSPNFDNTKLFNRQLRIETKSAGITMLVCFLVVITSVLPRSWGPNDTILERNFLPENDQQLLPKSLLKQLASRRWKSDTLWTFSQVLTIMCWAMLREVQLQEEHGSFAG